MTTQSSICTFYIKNEIQMMVKERFQEIVKQFNLESLNDEFDLI